MEKCSDCPVLSCGDYNCVMDGNLDRISADSSRKAVGASPLKRLCDEVGLMDVWRVKYLNKVAFSCFSNTHKAMSRIDLALCNSSCLDHIVKMKYEPNTTSDHYI
ncbi:hypothetical protein GDO81_006158 [Engystomops pustulosus]|uniref:Uncharacterized protein n=1 Tax=Engystomops pustulosus TaxID=76066 RepID=A0AAV7CUX1_ENGPU|nr:hypothetical protein GDO81_006158 [Engystomops pustulosus]